ncbi:hypothetical protein CKJ90_30465, partial [Klebsiella pneumoniae]
KSSADRRQTGSHSASGRCWARPRQPQIKLHQQRSITASHCCSISASAASVSLYRQESHQQIADRPAATPPAAAAGPGRVSHRLSCISS